MNDTEILPIRQKLANVATKYCLTCLAKGNVKKVIASKWKK